MSICTCVRMNAVCVCDPCVSIVYTCMRVHEERRKREREVGGGGGGEGGRSSDKHWHFSSLWFFSPLFFFRPFFIPLFFFPPFSIDIFIYVHIKHYVYAQGRTAKLSIDSSKNFASIISSEFFLFSTNILFQGLFL